MKLSSVARWLAIPLSLGVGAAGGVAATRWSQPKPSAIPQPGAGFPSNPFDLPDLPEAERYQKPEEPPIPEGFFDLPTPDPKDGPVPEPVRPGQWLNIEVLEALPGRPISGVRVVRKDGTISLGFYGELRVAGLDRHQIKVKVIEHLREFITDEVLGLYRHDPTHDKVELVRPVDSNRVFVDDAADQYDWGQGKSRQGEGDELRGRVERLERELRELRESRSAPEPAAEPK